MSNKRAKHVDFYYAFALVMTKDSSAPSPPWRQALADYLSAVATHHEAEKLYWRALRIFCKLGRRCSDSRAYELAGLGLADRRSIAAAAAKREAYTALKQALKGEPAATVITALGAAVCATSLPRPANEP